MPRCRCGWIPTSTDADAIEGDLRRPEAILDHPTVQGLLDFSRPIGLLLIAMLHFVPDADDPAGIVAGLRGRMAAGLVPITDWRPEPDAADTPPQPLLAAVGRQT